ncbi:MAG: hypothetical protein WCJ35_05085 [Planctomycetota bacterium]
MTKRTMRFWLPAILLAFSPAVAYADAGTPLMWASTLHLLFGNAVIGVAEGLILAFLFRLKGASCVAIMIASNYFSAWVGGVFLISTITDSLSLDLYNAWRWLWCMVVVSYGITLVLEWPFIAICLRNTNGWFRKSIWGSLVVQSASYLVLFGWYWTASGKTLYTDLVIVQPSAMSLPKDAILYYMAENNDDVYVRDMGHDETRKICALTSSENSDRLFLNESRVTAGHWDLIVGLNPLVEQPDPNPSNRTVSADLMCSVAEAPLASLWPGGEVPRFRADKSGWLFYFGWMAGRLTGENTINGRNVLVSLDTPFVRWPVYCPTQLPSGQVIFQLGRNQICILDPDERKIAMLAKGRWPVITIVGGERIP